MDVAFLINRLEELETSDSLDDNLKNDIEIFLDTWRKKKSAGNF